MPVQTNYQFTQVIDEFQEKYGAAEDNEAIKNMTYMQKKQILVDNFGVEKAKRHTKSLITNRVEDDGVINKEGYGTRDAEILAKAEKIE